MSNVTKAHLGDSKSANCPSCGRFVGPYESCPYCGAKMKGRIPVRYVKIAAILLATVGLVGLWIAARYTEIPTLTASAAMGTMNMAYVKIEGRVARSLTYDPEGGYLAFWVDDGTGEVRISSYRDVTQAILDSGMIPAPGDDVTVAGTLRIREDYVALTLNVPEHLELTRPEAVELRSDEITILDEGLRVRLSGVVRSVFEPYEGMTIITLADEGGEIAVTVDETLELLTGELPEIIEGQGIEVEGSVSLYKDSPQLSPAAVADITLSEMPPEAIVTVETRDIDQISVSDEGTWVQIQGRIVSMDGFKGGVKAILDDGTEQVLVLVWDSIYNAMEDPSSFDVGAEVEIKGEVQVYQGEIEVLPDTAEDIAISAAAPEIPWVEVRELTSSDVGRVVRLRGVLGEPDAFSAGVKVMLDDGSGSIVVLMWSNMVVELDRRPELGMTVEVIGVVEEYEGELEIIPRSTQDWRPAE